MNVAGLFSGIGGLEQPFNRYGATTKLLCDIWTPSQQVLKERFQGIPIHGDIARLKSLPSDIQIVTAGFPCTDLSQAGKTEGISGKDSGLVEHVFRLLKNQKIEWLILENVRNMLVLDKGKAMSYLVSELEDLGFRWAYRLVDSRFSGVPQRRHRILFVASRTQDPRQVLFADESGAPDETELRDNAFGFYWTEGLRGLGWAKDAVPPLKGGSSVGIPSPPAIWLPDAHPGRKIVTPSIEDAEMLQGFDRGWTNPAQVERRNGSRWKLVGNAVTVGVADWLISRLFRPGDVIVPNKLAFSLERWPDAAYGESGKIWSFEASPWPVKRTYHHLTEFLNTGEMQPLSMRATRGFLDRTQRSNLRFVPAFIEDLKQHISCFNNREKLSDPALYAERSVRI